MVSLLSASLSPPSLPGRTAAPLGPSELTPALDFLALLTRMPVDAAATPMPLTGDAPRPPLAATGNTVPVAATPDPVTDAALALPSMLSVVTPPVPVPTTGSAPPAPALEAGADAPTGQDTPLAPAMPLRATTSLALATVSVLALAATQPRMPVRSEAEPAPPEPITLPLTPVRPATPLPARTERKERPSSPKPTVGDEPPRGDDATPDPADPVAPARITTTPGPAATPVPVITPTPIAMRDPARLLDDDAATSSGSLVPAPAMAATPGAAPHNRLAAGIRLDHAIPQPLSPVATAPRNANSPPATAPFSAIPAPASADGGRPILVPQRLAIDAPAPERLVDENAADVPPAFQPLPDAPAVAAASHPAPQRPRFDRPGSEPVATKAIAAPPIAVPTSFSPVATAATIPAAERWPVATMVEAALPLKPLPQTATRLAAAPEVSASADTPHPIAEAALAPRSRPGQAAPDPALMPAGLRTFAPPTAPSVTDAPVRLPAAVGPAPLGRRVQEPLPNLVGSDATPAPSPGSPVPVPSPAAPTPLVVAGSVPAPAPAPAPTERPATTTPAPASTERPTIPTPAPAAPAIVVVPPEPSRRNAPPPAVVVADPAVPAIADAMPSRPRSEPAFRAFAAALFDAGRDPGVAPAAVAGAAAPAPTVAAPAATQPPLDLTQSRWPQAMVDRIERLRDDASMGDTRIRLIPDALGTIDVTLRREGETVHVAFRADQAETRQMLADARHELGTLAEQRGIKLGDTAVATAGPASAGSWSAGGQTGAGSAGGERSGRQHPHASTPAAPPRVASATDEPGDDIRIA